jgi:serine/threonine protein kinase
MAHPIVRGDSLASGARAGAWHVGREIGSGGMSTVHAACHELGHHAALKIVRRSVLGSTLTATTFLREAQIIRTIGHRGTAVVIGTGCHDGRPYLALERLYGTPLGALVDIGGALPPRLALDILVELCDVLDAAHARGIVHRDIKLDNVFVLDVPYARARRVKLLDWGVAHEVGKADPFCGMIAGTLSYVAPEQILGDELTPAVDVYALAVLAFRLLCGRTPFVATSDLALVEQHLRAEPPRPSSLWAEIPSELDELLVAMLAKRPVERPTLVTVRRALRKARAALAPRRTWWMPLAPPIDVLGRPALPVPRLSAGWIATVAALILIAELVR